MPSTPKALRRYNGSAKVRDRGLQRESWERVYWESLGRSQRENSRLGYRVDEPPKAEISEDDDAGPCHAGPTDTSPENKNLPRRQVKTQRRVDTESLWKHLWQSRKLVLAVKQGCSYFHLLQEQEVQEEQEREKRRREERRRRAIRPPCASSDSETDREAEREHMYRQLCCLCWLLESLTVEHPGRGGPVASCWDAKDPGRSRNTLKSLNKEKAIQAKWEQFVSPP
ncbi:hypothetical protein NFI96_009393, partial [Prochilodus magdalenae]